jgi:hypothetical protein
MTPRFRQVNQVLDAKPRIGPFPADLVFPWTGIALAIFLIANYLCKLDWLWTILLIAWGCATWWILVGSKPHRFLSKFIGVPRWSRGYVRHQSMRTYERVPSTRRSKTAARRKKRG